MGAWFSAVVERRRLAGVQKEDCELFIPQVRRGKVVDVYDGDTVTIAALPFPCKCMGTPSLFKVRLDGIDSPEMRGGTKTAKEKAAAVKSRDALKEQIMGKIIKLECVSFDKYGRLLATILYNDVNMNAWMIENGYAVEYDGGKKPMFGEN
eukprot:GEMP01078521.1.p1 GENE.GEMP01078521.1~~GEMP01078521.1.p1  ORF type:complete len:174 (+),score=36.55 GEMP01078521.1:72-524(+)